MGEGEERRSKEGRRKKNSRESEKKELYTKWRHCIIHCTVQGDHAGAMNDAKFQRNSTTVIMQ